MAVTARVIWLCACVRYWPYCGVVLCDPRSLIFLLLFFCRHRHRHRHNIAYVNVKLGRHKDKHKDKNFSVFLCFGSWLFRSFSLDVRSYASAYTYAYGYVASENKAIDIIIRIYYKGNQKGKGESYVHN